jgi:hypothetical protein
MRSVGFLFRPGVVGAGQKSLKHPAQEILIKLFVLLPQRSCKNILREIHKKYFYPVKRLMSSARKRTFLPIFTFFKTP